MEAPNHFGMKLSSVAMEQFVSLALGAGARSESGERVQNRLATGTGKLRCNQLHYFPSNANAQARPNETVLRVGPLELDLIDRTAKRGDRPTDLRPREFHLLKYMMQRIDQLLTRATLFKDVWHYKFVPETNLVDVHMGRLRRKVDGANEAP